jgi:hypothetical protein
MGKIKPRTETGKGNATTGAVCKDCHLNLTMEHDWPTTARVYHCEGQSNVGQPHHHRTPTWGKCWKCGKPLGCMRCAAYSIVEAFCRRCGLWGTKEAFVEQGLLGGQTVEQYPAGWHDAYYATRSFRNQGAGA